jgi:hypothetical protein
MYAIPNRKYENKYDPITHPLIYVSINLDKKYLNNFIVNSVIIYDSK